MNKNQTVVMWVAIVIIVVMCVFTLFKYPEGIIDYGFHLGQVAGVALVSGGLIYTLRTKKKPSGD